jgi:putative transposase
MCHVLLVSRAGYYAWLGRPESPRSARVGGLLEPIREAHRASDGTYGSPRVYRDLKAKGFTCCEKTVARLMRRDGLRAANSRRFVVHTTDSRHDHPIAGNTLDRQFEPGEIDRVWVADITYIATGEGWLYLAAVLDLGSRMVVGFATADHLRSELAERALGNALACRRPTGPLLHHSDRGVQYACDAYQELLRGNGLEVSMSRKGNCHDNAVMESFFGTLKQELVYRRTYKTREEAQRSLFAYIEVFYNRKRLHSTLGYVSPVQYEESRKPTQPSAHAS